MLIHFISLWKIKRPSECILLCTHFYYWIISYKLIWRFFQKSRYLRWLLRLRQLPTKNVSNGSWTLIVPSPTFRPNNCLTVSLWHNDLAYISVDFQKEYYINYKSKTRYTLYLTVLGESIQNIYYCRIIPKKFVSTLNSHWIVVF